MTQKITKSQLRHRLLEAASQLELHYFLWATLVSYDGERANLIGQPLTKNYTRRFLPRNIYRSAVRNLYFPAIQRV